MNIFRRLFRRSRTSGGTNDGYIEPRSGVIFPIQLGGLQRLATGRTYADGDRKGESIAYGKDDVQATIYVTKVGEARPVDATDSRFVCAELEGAMAAVKEMERLGRYQAVKFFTADPERLGTDPGNLIWSRGAFLTVTNGHAMTSFIYISVLRGLVIKLRISAASPQGTALTEFPCALGDLISRQCSKQKERT